MKIGIDSYSFHRIFGDVRGGETEPGRHFRSGSLDAIAVAARLRVDSISLQTCFLGLPDRPEIARLRTALGPLEPVIAWGHPQGLEFGTALEAADELDHWIDVAPELRCDLVRLVAGNSGTDRGGRPIEFLADALGRHIRAARDRGVRLALENHADLTVPELELLVSLVDDPVLGICLDTANALRVGDDPLDATVRLLPQLRMVHLKDVEGLAFEPSVGPRSVAYGTGVVAVREILATLVRAGFDGHVMVELGYLGPGDVDEEELLEVSLGWLAEALDGLRASSVKA